MNDTTTNQVAPDDQRGLWERLMSKAFPRSKLPIPEDDRPGFAPAYLLVYVEAHLDWRDRLRMLVSGKCEVQVRIYTDVAVKRTFIESRYTVLKP